MDFKERLIRNDMRNLAENVKAISEELILLQEFVKHQFNTELLEFLRTRKDPMNATAVALDGSSLRKIPKLDESAYDDVSRKRDVLESTRSRKHVSRKKPKIADDKDEDVELFALYPQTCIKTDNGNADDIGNNDGEDFHLSSPYVEENFSTKREPEIDEEYERNPENLAADDIGDDDTYSDYDEDNEIDSDPEFVPSSSKSSRTKRNSRRTTNLKKSAKNKEPEPLLKEFSSNANVTCPICEVSVSNKFKLKDHLSEHSEAEAIENLVCQICCLKYPDNEVYTSHMEKGHEKDAASRWTCSYCGKHCKKKGHLIEHLRIHTGEKPFQCEVCNKFFTRNSHRKDHLRNIHKIAT